MSQSLQNAARICFIGLLVPLALILTLIILIILSTFLLAAHRAAQAPRGIPWVGVEGSGWYAKARASILAFSNEQQYLAEGYEKYSRHGKPFILPGLHWAEVVLPPQDVKWLASLPEKDCDTIHVQEELLGLRYLSHGPDLKWVHDFSNIRRDLKSHMAEILPEVLNEVEIAFCHALGRPKTWTHPKALNTMKTATIGTFNRITVGQPLCRDDRYLAAVVRMVIAFALSGVIYRSLIPKPLRQWVMQVLSLPYRWALWKVSKMHLPTVKKRVEEYKTLTCQDHLPSDMLQWTIERSFNKTGPAITVDVVLDTVLIDVLSYPESMLIQQLRREADEALPGVHRDPLSALAEMPKLDSVIRETLRIHPINDHGMMRQIVKPGGVTTSSGLCIPQGTYVGAHVAAMQRDTAMVHDADQFRPLRFYEEYKEKAELPVTATHISDKFLPFALGRHACPGRFFAVHVLEMILAHLFATYDFEPLSDRPVVRSMGGINTPDGDTIIGVRLRQIHAGWKD